MKLSNDTLSILKNFANINQGIFFKKGNILKTVSPHKNILAEVNISEDIPCDFGIYNLNEFLSVVSLYKDDHSFKFDENQATIIGNKGRSKKNYRFCKASVIVVPPEKTITVPDAEIKFELSSEDFDWILKNAAVLQSPNVAVTSDGKKINIVAYDAQNDSAHTETLEISDGNGSKFHMIFKTESLTKLMSGSYDVEISSKGISHFINKNIPLQYWVTTEAGSKFEK